MAHTLLTSLDLSGNEILNVVMQNLANGTGVTTEGRLFYNSTSKRVNFHNGTSVVALLTAADSTGDMLKSDYDSVGDGVVNSARAAPWSGITGKPTTFTPATHNQAWSTIQSTPTTLSGYGITDGQPLTAVLTATSASFTTALKNKVDAIEASADVTDTANVTSSGALMDSEVTNLAAVKAFNAADYAAASHGHTASDVTDFDTAVQTKIAAYWDTLAGTDANVDTIRELLTLVLDNEESLLTKVKRHQANMGDTTATSFAITHSFNTRDLIVQIYDTATFEQVITDVTFNTVDQVTIDFATAPGTDAYRAVIVG